VLPDGRQLTTLEDAGDCITELPEAVHEAPEWQAAMEALILVVKLGGPTMFARIGFMKALNRHVERVFDSSRKDTHWESESSRGTNDDRLDLRRHQIPSWPPRLSEGVCKSGRRGRMVQGERSRRRGIRIRGPGVKPAAMLTASRKPRPVVLAIARSAAR
jgi:hypothetical protein